MHESQQLDKAAGGLQSAQLSPMKRKPDAATVLVEGLTVDELLEKEAEECGLAQYCVVFVGGLTFISAAVCMFLM